MRLDAIAPRREQVVGEVEKRVVAQLLALMDGLAKRNKVIVIGATNLPNVLDPALRRPGRFDREIAIPIPDRHGRREILEIHSRGMPLERKSRSRATGRISRTALSGPTWKRLCREAAMLCLRRIMPDVDFGLARIPYDQLAKLEVKMDDFLSALQDHRAFGDARGVCRSSRTFAGRMWEVWPRPRHRLVEAVEWPLQYPGLFTEAGIRPPKGILLSGPPGCGKTLLAKAIASESNVNFISVKGPELLSKYVGESEKAVREIFRKARQAAPCIIFFDEIDALVPSRSAGGSDSHISERVLSQFLTELDGVEELHGVLVLGATNRMDMLDPAIVRPGRFDEIVEIPLPDEAGRADIFRIQLRSKPLSAEVSAEKLGRRSEGHSGAEIAAVCHQAALAAIRRAVRASEGPAGGHAKVSIEASDLEAAFESIRR